MKRKSFPWFIFVGPTILMLKSIKGGRDHELQCKQVHRMYCEVLRLPLRHWKLLLSGPHSGWHPWSKSHSGSVHRLQVLPQEVKNPMRRQQPPHFLLHNSWREHRKQLWYAGEYAWTMKNVPLSLKKDFGCVHIFFISGNYDGEKSRRRKSYGKLWK